MSYTDIIAVLMCDSSCHDLAQEWLDDMWETACLGTITYTSILVAA
jgi:hypothetical protein